MNILVTNDDGIRAPGIAALANELKKYHDVTIVAPAEEKSGVSHGFTFLTPLMSQRVDGDLGFEDMKAYAVSGTPVDCVKLGNFHMVNKQPPDFVVSGINRGANLGTDVLYSGTASAAMEAAILGIPALAVSSCSFEPTNYQAAARCALDVLRYLEKHPLPEGIMLNLNVPDLPYEQIRGLMPTKLALRRYANFFDQRTNPRGKHYFWLSDELTPRYHEDSDESWEHEGFATVTPVGINPTHHEYLAQMRSHTDFEDSMRACEALVPGQPFESDQE